MGMKARRWLGRRNTGLQCPEVIAGELRRLQALLDGGSLAPLERSFVRGAYHAILWVRRLAPDLPSRVPLAGRTKTGEG